MSHFRVNLTVEVDRVANALAVQMPVSMQIAYESGTWSASCADPAVCTDACRTFDEALAEGAGRVADEMQASVFDRPVVLTRITPEDLPAGWF